MRWELIALHVVFGHGGLPLGRPGVSRRNYRRGGKVAGWRIQGAGLALLSPSRLLLRPKSAVSCGKRPGVNLASGKERTDCLIHHAV
jgi:hypothetical protein